MNTRNGLSLTAARRIVICDRVNIPRGARLRDDDEQQRLRTGLAGVCFSTAARGGEQRADGGASAVGQRVWGRGLLLTPFGGARVEAGPDVFRGRSPDPG